MNLLILISLCQLPIYIHFVSTYVLFAANVEDFKRLAKKFVPEIFADRLADIAARSASINKNTGDKSDNPKKPDSFIANDGYFEQSDSVDQTYEEVLEKTTHETRFFDNKRIITELQNKVKQKFHSNNEKEIHNPVQKTNVKFDSDIIVYEDADKIRDINKKEPINYDNKQVPVNVYKLNRDETFGKGPLRKDEYADGEDTEIRDINNDSVKVPINNFKIDNYKPLMKKTSYSDNEYDDREQPATNKYKTKYLETNDDNVRLNNKDKRLSNIYKTKIRQIIAKNQTRHDEDTEVPPDSNENSDSGPIFKRISLTKQQDSYEGHELPKKSESSYETTERKPNFNNQISLKFKKIGNSLSLPKKINAENDDSLEKKPKNERKDSKSYKNGPENDDSPRTINGQKKKSYSNNDHKRPIVHRMNPKNYDSKYIQEKKDFSDDHRNLKSHKVSQKKNDYLTNENQKNLENFDHDHNRPTVHRIRPNKDDSLEKSKQYHRDPKYYQDRPQKYDSSTKSNQKYLDYSDYDHKDSNLHKSVSLKYVSTTKDSHKNVDYNYEHKRPRFHEIIPKNDDSLEQNNQKNSNYENKGSKPYKASLKIYGSPPKDPQKNRDYSVYDHKRPTVHRISPKRDDSREKTTQKKYYQHRDPKYHKDNPKKYDSSTKSDQKYLDYSDYVQKDSKSYKAIPQKYDSSTKHRHKNVDYTDYEEKRPRVHKSSPKKDDSLEKNSQKKIHFSDFDHIHSNPQRDSPKTYGSFTKDPQKNIDYSDYGQKLPMSHRMNQKNNGSPENNNQMNKTSSDYQKEPIFHKIKEQPENNDTNNTDYSDERKELTPLKNTAKPAVSVENISHDVEGRTENLNYDDNKQEKVKKILKNTMIPTKRYYTFSSPNYYAKLPTVAEKYDFDEPLPEQDREKEDLKYFSNPPSKINGKVGLNY